MDRQERIGRMVLLSTQEVPGAQEVLRTEVPVVIRVSRVREAERKFILMEQAICSRSV